MMNIPHVERNRLQGWLNIANTLETESLDKLDWHRRYCILDKDERRLSFFNDTESVLMAPQSPIKFNFHEGPDGSAMSSQRKSVGTIGHLDPSFNAFQRNNRQTRSFRDKVKSSLKGKKKPDTLVQGGSVRVARSRSFGKTDRIDQNSGLKLGHSMENLYRVSSHGIADNYAVSLGEDGTSLDLAMRGTLSILPLHQSVSPRHSTFRIVTESDIIYASCGSQEDLDKWLTNLNNCRKPNHNHLRRLDTQLTLWVMEARNLVPKKKYFCEIYLNRILYAQTCCKLMNDNLFWGEPFIFDDLPPLGSIMIKLCRENLSKKKKEKPASLEVGNVEIPALILESGHVHEKWHPVNMVPVAKGSSSAMKEKERDGASIRFKIHYHMVSIEPLKIYDDFLKLVMFAGNHLRKLQLRTVSHAMSFLCNDYSVVCEVLEPVIPAKAKDEIAQTLIYILQVFGKAKDFLCDIVMAEVKNIENENLIFRGNTFATKAVDTYMKMVGEIYLHETLAPFINLLLENEDDCEVDPTKMQPGANLHHNKDNLVKLVKRAWLDILSSYTKFPSDLQNTLHSIRTKFGSEKEDACFKLISGSIFLRFFCPAILSPSLFHLCQEYPNEKTARKLTLVAKVIQNLANFARFGVKEEYMCFMNDFVMEEIKNMKEFIKKISSPHPESHPVVEWKQRHIDLGREASIIHSILSTQLKSLTLSDSALSSVGHLRAILDGITRAGNDDEEDPLTSTFAALQGVMQTTISQFGASNNDGDNSESSSEYTTPAQSQTTSPSHEQSPPPPGAATQMAHATVGSAAKLMTMQHNGGGNGGITHQETVPNSTISPNHSPTHSERVSSLATHSHSATMPTKPRSSNSNIQVNILDEDKSSGGGGGSSDAAPRKKFDPELIQQRHGGGGGGSSSSTNKVRPASQQGQMSQHHHHHHHQPKHAYNTPPNCSVTKYDEQLEISRLKSENTRLQYDVEKLQRRLEQCGEEAHKDNDKLRKSEEAKRQVDHDLRQVKESRSKVFRGLNTQAEIVMVQFKRDIDNLKKQLQAKDDIIHLQDKKIASLIEVNATLDGLAELNSLPSSESDIEDDDDPLMGSDGSRRINGHTRTVRNGPRPHSDNLNPELLQVISQLDSGRFDS